MSSHGGSSGGGASPATTVTGPDAFGASAVVGTGTHYARNDHDHGLPAAPSVPAAATTVTGPDAYGASAAVGTGTHYARNDHDHGLPAAPTGGGLLAVVQYAPAIFTNYAMSSATPAAVDVTNLTIAFTAPASGKVLVRLAGTLGSVIGNGYFCLLDHTTAAQVSYSVFASTTQNATNIVAADFLITGLTPAGGYQYDWGWCTTTSMNMNVIGGTGIPTTNYASPAVMEVFSA
jgi:hypothetical protein